jgi:hypothetical protein
LTRQHLIDVVQLVGLLGLGLLFYGWAWYPPLAWPMATANLAYLAALAVAWAACRITDRR